MGAEEFTDGSRESQTPDRAIEKSSNTIGAVLYVWMERAEKGSQLTWLSQVTTSFYRIRTDDKYQWLLGVQCFINLES